VLDKEDVLKVIGYLQKQKYWHCDEGPCELYEKFNDKTPFDEKDLAKCF
jgi:hypothetical protein